MEEIGTDAAEPTAAVSELESAAEEIATLREALETRTMIGQAVGMLMTERTLTADEAFADLITQSSHRNVKVRTIAAEMLAAANARAAKRGRGVTHLLTAVNVPAPGSGATGTPIDSGLLA